jgi:dCTP deaminase
MILTGSEIKSRIGTDIQISDFDESRLNPNSYNLRLNNTIAEYSNQNPAYLDIKRFNPLMNHEIPDKGMILHPGTLYLARTMEHTETKNLVPMLEGRSSMARLGISIHVTAGFGDIGFRGYWTLEISVIEPVKIYAEIEVCQIYYNTVCGKIDREYKGKYQDNKGLQGSGLWRDFK